MKKLMLLLLLSANAQIMIQDNKLEICVTSTAFAQHMYREAGDNCKLNNKWYQVTDLCNSPEQSSLRCEYCGLYFTTVTLRNTHQKTCKHRPHIEFEYDNAGNRIERVIENYRLGGRVVAYNHNVPTEPQRGNQDLAMRIVPVAFAIKRDELEMQNKKNNLA